MSDIRLKIAAKTDVGLVRTNNEDNFQLDPDLTTGSMFWTNDDVFTLGENGTLLVVADGMGGMNAGEVASEIAIQTVKDRFQPENLTADVKETRYSIEKFMNSVIVEADERIKAHAKAHPETHGMGTTIVIAWILADKLYVSWCGDSRAYIYNPEAGLHQITKDHSYVQTLVDKGSISREDAFDFPDSNIITRCLSDGSTKAKPESLLKPFNVCNDDIILLCTDGLCGMIRDNEIEAVIRNNPDNLNILTDELIKAALDAEGADNVTVCLCKIIDGAAQCDPEAFVETEKRLNGRQPSFLNNTIVGNSTHEGGKNRKWLWISLAVLSLAAIGILIFCLKNCKGNNQQTEQKTNVVVADSIPTEPRDTVNSEPQSNADTTNITPTTTNSDGNDNGAKINNPLDKATKKDGKKTNANTVPNQPINVKDIENTIRKDNPDKKEPKEGSGEAVQPDGNSGKDGNVELTPIKKETDPGNDELTPVSGGKAEETTPPQVKGDKQDDKQKIRLVKPRSKQS